ncbi:MAG: DUF1501 domain-containing protein [Acidobacteria bacterium]|nr:DUF1501 domain-containing protein [Acidobacteriota bacterium]
MSTDRELGSWVSRRRVLFDSGAGFGWLALSWLLSREKANAGPSGEDRKPHFAPKAKRVVQIFCVGGMSHLDTFDYKPELSKRSGAPFDMPTFFGQAGNLLGSLFEFKQRGESGLWVSSLLPHLAECADKLTVIRSMVSKSANHMPAIAQMNTGFILTGFPSMGAWVVYALGTENENLPSFVVIPDPRAHPWGGTLQWSNGFLPAAVQGTVFRSSGDPVPNLSTPPATDPAARQAGMEWLAAANRRYAREQPGGSDLEARLRGYELAARMQLSVPETANLKGEPEATRRMYGLTGKETEALGTQCLLARRLLERGVRFVQIYHGGSGSDWDAHGSLESNHQKRAQEYDQPVAALLEDLDAGGLLRDTLVMGVTEFGRTPVSQGTGKTAGRDHHPECFTCWMAGAGLRPGSAYGASDELGYRPAESPVTVHDYHATALHLLGLDHEKLTFYHNGIRRRLTDVHGRVVEGILL